MKKLLILTMLVISSVNFALAQNYAEISVDTIQNWQVFNYCMDEYYGAIIYGRPGCPENEWHINGELVYADSIVLENSNNYAVSHYACYQSVGFEVSFWEFDAVSPFAEPVIWKRQGESVTLGPEWPGMYNLLWSNGSTENQIEVTTPGIYTVTYTHVYGCGSATFSVEVRDNAEIEVATCDLESNHNMVTWPTTPEQAEYISQVEIKRDGMVVGTVDYTAGTFIDGIGSDAASRTYQITAIDTDGVPCSIVSLPKETIHMAYLNGINNTIEINWNEPTGYDLIRYNICEWRPNGTKEGDLTVIDYVLAGVTSYTCSESQFDNGNIVVQGVEEDGKTESRLFSNRSWETLTVNEVEGKTRKFEMYPNPADGPVTIKANELDSENEEFNVTITNLNGQIVATGVTKGGVFTTEKLTPGVYTVNFDGNSQTLIVK